MLADFKILMGHQQEEERRRKSQVMSNSVTNLPLLPPKKNHLKKSTHFIREDRTIRDTVRR
jgi:hypothetical protein